MKNIKKISLIAMIAMAIVSVSSLFGLKIAGILVIVGAVFFFINKALKSGRLMAATSILEQ